MIDDIDAALAEDGDQPDDSKPTVVGIGTSAGGLSALRRFFAAVPADSGLTYVVVMHLAPDHQSHLADLLQPHVEIPVLQVTETTALLADHVYVIPPGRNLNTIDTHLRLSPLEEQRSERAPIDHFLSTLAETHDSNAVGVILTGTGSDGTTGLGTIKERGGLTIAQDPDEAEYDGMPQNAVASGLVDLVLRIDDMLEHILRFAKAEPLVEIPIGDEDLDDHARQVLQKIFTQVTARTGNDLSGYKRATVMRRIRRRMQLHQLATLSDYLQLLRDERPEVEQLFEDLLISVTSFFRDADVFEELEREVIPALFEGKGAVDTVRVWTVGCSTGEEAYSIAMLLLEHAARLDHPPRVVLFASDLHEHSLRQARDGIYPISIESDVSPDRLRRFFTKENGAYRIRKEVREVAVFAPHNLLSDPPFSHVDLVSCRNLLIYLQRDVQRSVISLFHYALNPNGFLLLGTSETIDQSDLFTTRDKRLCLFRRRDVQSLEPRLPMFSATRTGPAGRPGPRRAPVDPSFGALHERMVEQYAPPSILLDPDHRIVHYSANAGRYLVHPGGEPTQDIYRLLRDDLRVELRTALHTSQNEGGSAQSEPVPTTFDGRDLAIVIRVRPATDEQLAGFVLVIFDEVAAAGDAHDDEDDADRSATNLEHELDVTKHRLQALIAEYEASQEEMRAANEELQSTNEELRSTMEELETSKEELQSMNEELTTLNQENRHKVEELSLLSSDLQNLLGATEIATIFLDRQLRIVRFTPQVGDIFSIRHSDRGRPLSDLTHRLGDGDLHADATQVLEQLIPVSREIERSDGRWMLTRIMPYRTADDRIEGVVMTFIDITERRTAERALQLLNEQLETTVAARTSEVRSIAHRYGALVEASSQIVWDADGGGRVFGDARAWQAYTGASQEQWLAGGWVERVHPDQRADAELAWRRAIDDRRPFNLEVRIAHAPSGGWRWTQVSAVPLDGQGPDAAPGWVGTITDIESRKQAEQQLRHMASAVTLAEQRERSRIAQVLHDDLQQLLSGLQMKLGFARERINGDGNGEATDALGDLDEATQWLGRGIEMTRALSVELSPPVLETDDLADTMRWLLGQMQEMHGLRTELSVPQRLQLHDQDMQILLYQAVRELLFNVAKHADVGQAAVEIIEDDEWLAITIQDGGIGFDTGSATPSTAPSSGLLRIRNRLAVFGGELDIESEVGHGTRATIRLPHEVLTLSSDGDAR